MNATTVTNDSDNITDLNTINDYDNNTFTNCTNIENEDLNIIFKYLLLSIPSSILLFSLISLMVYTLIKPLINNK